MMNKKAIYHRADDFTLLHGDCIQLMREFDFKFDMIFADPPYFLSNGGISVQSGKVVCVDKGEWDKGGTPEHIGPVQRGMDCGMQGTPDGERNYLDFGNLSQHFLCCKQTDATRIQNPQCHHMGEDKSTAQYLVPVLYLQHRVHHLGKKVPEEAALLQL